MFAMGPSFIVPFLEQLAEFAPSLEHLSFLKQGDLGLSDKITLRFADALNSFPKLQGIDLHRGAVHQSRVLVFVKSLKTIRWIYVFTYRGYNEESIIEVEPAQLSAFKVLHPPLDDTIWWMNEPLARR